MRARPAHRHVSKLPVNIGMLDMSARQHEAVHRGPDVTRMRILRLEGGT